jgi:hypothetical protein
MLCLLQCLFAGGCFTNDMLTQAAQHMAQTLARQLFIVDD